jgi:protein phosphatase
VSLAVDSRTHIGLLHHTNEDSWTTFDTPSGQLLAVCDGMGGMGRGDEASAIAVQVLEEELSSATGFAPERMESAVQTADVAIRKKLAVPGNTPGSTAVLVHVEGGLAHVTWAGDSRAYLMRGGEVIDRTRDHKLVNELVDAGELSEAEAKVSTLAHVVTKALGGRGPNEPPILPDSLPHPWKLKQGDLILLCSDGLCDLVDDEELGRVVDGVDLGGDLDHLVQMALDRGGHDNITIILARWDGPDFDEEEQETPVFTDMRSRTPSPARDLEGASSTWEEDELTRQRDALREDDAETIPPAPDREEAGGSGVPGGPSPYGDEVVEPGEDRDGRATLDPLLDPIEPPASEPEPDAPPRDPSPEETPKPWLAVAIALVALALIVFGILVMRGVFTQNVGVDGPNPTETPAP